MTYYVNMSFNFFLKFLSISSFIHKKIMPLTKLFKLVTKLMVFLLHWLKARQGNQAKKAKAKAKEFLSTYNKNI